MNIPNKISDFWYQNQIKLSNTDVKYAIIGLTNAISRIRTVKRNTCLITTISAGLTGIPKRIDNDKIWMSHF